MMDRGRQGRAHCAAYSAAVGEDLAGTVKQTELWLLVECRGRREREASAGFSQAVQNRLGALKIKTPKMRFALIKQPQRRSGPLRVYWVFSRETKPQIFQTEVSSYDELSLDTRALPNEVDTRVYAVCTHGTHDICCAQFGNQIYAQLREFRDNVWEILHIGGCRFAPNLACFPHGVIYGRVTPTECTAIVEAYEGGHIFPQKMRGRSCYSRPVQAAERFLRSAKQLTGLDEATLAGAEETDSGRWLVRFLGPNAEEYQVSVVVERDHFLTYKSCSATDLSRRERYRVVSHQVAQP